MLAQAKPTLSSLLSQTQHLHVPLLVFLTLIPLYYISLTQHSTHRPKTPATTSTSFPKTAQARQAFITTYLETHTTPIPDRALSALCTSPFFGTRPTTQTTKKWRPSLVLSLADANGGIGNLRGNVLDFLSLAIASGASVMLPSFAARSSSDISSLWDGRVDFGEFFDEGFFVEALGRWCPGLAVYKAREGMRMVGAIGDRFSPGSMRGDLEVGRSVGVVVGELEGWLRERGVGKEDREGNVTVVDVGRTLWDGPDTRSLPKEVRWGFGGLLRLKPEVRRLAAVATWNLRNRFLLDLDPADKYYRNAFFGAHLRTEQDAANAGWLSDGPHANFSSQTTTYIQQAASENLRVIYCASGSSKDLARFHDIAWRVGRMNVTNKHDLLNGTDLKELQAMTWDQQALVDYEILQRATYFGGYVKSSFSFNIALVRNVMLEQEGRLAERVWYEMEPGPINGGIAFQDDLSVVWGRDDWHEKKIPRGAWP